MLRTNEELDRDIDKLLATHLDLMYKIKDLAAQIQGIRGYLLRNGPPSHEPIGLFPLFKSVE